MNLLSIETAIITIIALVIIFKFLKWRFIKKKIPHILLEEAFGTHNFFLCQTEGSELLHVYKKNKIKKRNETGVLYNGVKPIMADVSKHPLYWLRKYQRVILHYCLLGQPFTTSLKDGLILDQKKKSEVLKEQGHEKNYKEHGCSDTDYMKADYANNLYYSAVKDSAMAMKKKRFSSITGQLMITSGIAVAYFFFNSNIVDQIFKLIIYLVETFL